MKRISRTSFRSRTLGIAGALALCFSATAQADAIKKWPRLLMEEVEKAVELNPNRRLSPSGAAPRTDLSVVDAIEQGLITIDYDDSATDL